MLKNYLHVALRSLTRRKGFSLINILGLATGMAVCLLIVLFVQSELRYDEHHGNGQNIYRVVLDRLYPGRTTGYAAIPQSFGPAIQREAPEVKEVTRVFNFGGGGGNFFMRVGDKVFEEKNVLAVDSNFFRVFSGQFVSGNRATALQQQNTVVLSESAAMRMYGSAAAAVGKQFLTDGDGNNNFLVTGVCKDWPAASHFTFDVLLSVSGFPFIRQDNYTGFAAHTYLLLTPGADPKKLEAKLPVVVEKYVSPAVEKAFNQRYADFKKAGNGYNYYLQPLQKIHLTSNLEVELRPNGSMTTVYIFGVVAVAILFLACINFINLSTARSVERAKEVGIRKTFGSEKKALVVQFLVESVLISLLALVLAVGLMFVLLPLFNQLSGKDLTHRYLFDPFFLLTMILLALAVGVVAGLYPAFVLSSFPPVAVLKGRFKSAKKGLVLRHGLVVFQFTVSVVLIIAAVVVNQQMQFMLGNGLGFKQDHVVVVERADLLGRSTEAFKTEVGKMAGVQTVTGASSLPGIPNFFGTVWQKENNTETLTGRGLVADQAFAKTLGLQLKEGRFFSKEFGTDSLAVVLNERAVAELNLGPHPLGARLTTPDQNFNPQNGAPYVYTVVGVLNDFHYQSLHRKISPLIVLNSARFDNGAGVLAIRVSAGSFKEAVAGIESQWKTFVKDHPFHYRFLDQTLADQYTAEQTAQKIFTAFSSLAVFIACIGLLGLVAYSTQQRTREIGIRKVLGASPASIVNMLSKDFLRLVLLASLIGLPLAWWGAHNWLQSFAYRVGIRWWMFAAAAVATAAVAFFTISVLALRAASANPVKSLHTE